MSADNGIYIAKFSDGECRVAHFTNVEECFGVDAKSFIFINYHSAFTGTLEECIAEAEKILLDLDVCEYGICELDFAHPFPQMTLEEANKILDF